MRLIASSLFVLFTLSAAADYKIVERTSSGNNSFTTVRWVQGQRQRVQNGNGEISIFQCDRHQALQLNPKNKLYRVIPLADDGFPLRRPTFSSDKRQLKVSTVELPDKSTVFGHPAWHVKDTMEDARSGFVHTIDSWYVDLPITEGCIPLGRPPAPFDQTEGPQQNGKARRGYAVLTRRLYSTPPTRSDWTTTVVEFTEARFDPSLFEVPPDYQEALDANLSIPNTPTNRAKRAWNNMWTALAHFIYE